MPHVVPDCSLHVPRSESRVTNLVRLKLWSLTKHSVAAAGSQRESASVQALRLIVEEEFEESRWECVDCGALFDREKILIIHRRSHSQEVPFACGKCDLSPAIRIQSGACKAFLELLNTRTFSLNLNRRKTLITPRNNHLTVAHRSLIDLMEIIFLKTFDASCQIGGFNDGPKRALVFPDLPEVRKFS